MTQTVQWTNSMWASATRSKHALQTLVALAALAGGLQAPLAAQVTAQASAVRVGPKASDTDPASAGARVAVDDALRLAFPGASFEKRTEYLSAEQRAKAGKLCGQTLERGVFTTWIAKRDKQVVGFALVDSHRVRALSETVLVALDTGSHIVRIEVLAFDEPQEYLPRRAFYDQFEGRTLDRELELKRGLRSVLGATLTARATTDCARRALAVQAVLQASQPAAQVASKP